MLDADARPFDELLRYYRLAAGLTQEDLADHAGLSIRAISDLERGINRAPHRETVALLAGALDLPPAQREAFIRAVPRRVRTNRSSPAPSATALPPLLPPLSPTPLVGRGGEVFALRALLTTPPRADPFRPAGCG